MALPFEVVKERSLSFLILVYYTYNKYMGIDLLIKIFILFFIKIVNLLLHYAMEDRPVKENITDKSIKKKEDISQVSNQMKSQTISMKTFLNFTDKKLTVIPLSCWLFSEPLISTSL